MILALTDKGKYDALKAIIEATCYEHIDNIYFRNYNFSSVENADGIEDEDQNNDFEELANFDMRGDDDTKLKAKLVNGLCILTQKLSHQIIVFIIFHIMRILL